MSHTQKGKTKGGKLYWGKGRGNKKEIGKEASKGKKLIDNL